jgi:lipopolysaccharide transport system permease protein
VDSVENANLINKVYFPRLTIPLSGVLSGLVDFVVGLALLAVLTAAYRVPLTPAVLLLPFFLFLAMITALGFGLWLSALNMRYRDIKQIAIRFDTLSKLYPEPAARTSHIGVLRQRPDSPSAALRTYLRGQGVGTLVRATGASVIGRHGVGT